MDLNALQTFDDVVRRGTFSAAARQLGVSPSHVSRQIAALERELGVRLLQRTTRKTALTEAGRAYHERVAPLLEELDAAGKQLGDVGDMPRGLVRVAAPGSFVQDQVVPWLVDLRRDYPELDVELVLDVRVSDLVEERIDVAIRLGRLQPSALIATKLCDMPRVVVGSPDYLRRRGHPRTPKDIVGHDCLAFPFEGYDASWSFRDRRGRTERVDVTARIVVAEGIVLRDLAVRGVGLTLLPRWMVEAELRDGSLVDVFPRHDATGSVHDAAIWLVYPSREYLPLKVRAFVDFVKRRFADGPPWLR